jgi:hypothetical protein
MKQYLNIVSGSGPILHALLESKIHNTVVGIHAKKLGKATYLTAVTEIMLPCDEEPLIVLTGFDITGYRLENNALRLSDIETVIPFNSKFENPFAKNYKNIDTIGRN